MASNSNGTPTLRADAGGSNRGSGGPAKISKSKKPAARKSNARKQSDIEKKLHRAELLLSVSRRVAGFETLGEVLSKVVEITTDETNAERGTLFLNDPDTGELYSRVAQGELVREIRVLNDSGIAGTVFTANEGLIIHDAYADKRFNRTVDQTTGYTTKSILCVPVRTVAGEVIGVVQALNKKKGKFTKDDLNLLEALSSQAAVALQSTQQVERMRKSRLQEMEFLDVVSDVTSEIELDKLLAKVMGEATRMLKADRSTLFLNDEKTNELFSRVAMGDSIGEIRLPNHLGIAGAVFTSGKTTNIPHAYADLRFNPSFDKQTGYFTRSILCVPVVNKDSKVIGVTQVLNKRGGPFSDEDEQRLKAFTAQVSIGLENAKLFDDVQNMKNYNEGMLESMSNGVITLDEDGKIVTCNAAGHRIMSIEDDSVVGLLAEEFFVGKNQWVTDKITRVAETHEVDVTMDAEMVFAEESLSVNTTILPLISAEEDKPLGTMIMVEDISSEKRMKSTMSRYMDPGIADQLLEGGEDILGGQDATATILFSDVRGFTTLTETLGAQGTVTLLNDYFTIMVDCITAEEGMLDKFIGDAIMAAFGVPISHDDDEDRAVRASINMLTSLDEWNVEREAAGQPPVKMGIGLNTDKIVSGNIGSPKRMDYTMIGDGVNLAARLESACKQYAAQLLISEYTVAKLKGTYRMRDIDDVIVKGKTKPVCVFEVLDFHSDESFPNLMEVVNYFNDGRKHYKAGDWDKAIASFGESFALHPEDRLSDIYITRCKEMKKNPPKDWDGVLKLESK
ncbi:MAG: GAF domain-containing protein [Rhodospirillaceae bacterium]|jgi:adenylate cyclase|nr:GAF domain-containing protein [Rhodospirillaceae bacterium]